MGKGKKITLIVMLVLAILMGLMSAYGAMCVAYNPARLLDFEPPEIEPSANSLLMYYILVTQGLQWVFIAANILTWIAGIGSVVMLIALIAKWKFFYVGTIVSCSIGIVSSAVPALVIMIPGGSTPSYMRGVIWAIVLILLLIPGFRKSFNKNGIGRTDAEIASKSSAAAALLFFPGALIGLQAIFVGQSHMIIAAAQIYAYYGMVQAIQVGVGLLFMAIGVLIFAIAKIKARK